MIREGGRSGEHRTTPQSEPPIRRLTPMRECRVERRSEERTGVQRPTVFVRVVNTAIWVCAAALVGPILIGSFGGMLRHPGAMSDPGAPGAGIAVSTGPLLLNTTLVAVAVGVVAAAIGTIVAWSLPRRLPASVVAIGALPLVMPPYLAYAGWGVLRSPGWAIGDWISAQPGARAGELSYAFGVGLAVLGLALWAWPLAALIVGASVRRIDADLRTMMDHELRGPLAGALIRVRLVAPAIGAALLVVGLLVCGTAVPLHLANVPTLAINVWLMLDRSAPEQAWRAHAAAWPLYTLAVVAGWWLGGRLSAWSLGERVNAPERRAHGRGAGLAVVACVVGASFVAPAVLMVMTIRERRSIFQFWTISGEAVAHGALVASITGLVVALVAIAVSVSLGARREGMKPVPAGAWATRLLLMLGLAPGVLIGSGLVSGWNRIDPSGAIASSIVIEVLAHLARFGWIGAVGGCLLVRLEHPSLRDLRRSEGGDSALGYLRSRCVLDAPVLAAVGLCAAFLSMTEIEASVVVAVPGPGNLARQILNNLHFARNEELSASAVWIVASGLGVVLSVATLGLVRARTQRAAPNSP